MYTKTKTVKKMLKTHLDSERMCNSVKWKKYSNSYLNQQLGGQKTVVNLSYKINLSYIDWNFSILRQFNPFLMKICYYYF